jgi:uncharacterized protein
MLLEDHAKAVMVTTNLVCGEVWTVLRRRVGHSSAVHATNALAQSERIEVVRVSDDVERGAFNWLRHHDERRYSFVDATSFELMRERGITEALAFDKDFSAAGFVELRP